jgi:hypothetical protein
MAALEQPSAGVQKLMDQVSMSYEIMKAECTNLSKVSQDLMPALARMIESVVATMVEEQVNKMEKIVDAKIAEAVSCMTPVQANWLVVPVLLFLCTNWTSISEVQQF